MYFTIKLLEKTHTDDIEMNKHIKISKYKFRINGST